MADIFTPWQIKDLTIPNRLVRSATWEGFADDDGAPTHELINALADLAEGGVGLVITGYAYIIPEGLGLPKQTGVHIDALVGPLDPHQRRGAQGRGLGGHADRARRRPDQVRSGSGSSPWAPRPW